jgi:hypothetical protein
LIYSFSFLTSSSFLINIPIYSLYNCSIYFRRSVPTRLSGIRTLSFFLKYLSSYTSSIEADFYSFIIDPVRFCISFMAYSLFYCSVAIKSTCSDNFISFSLSFSFNSSIILSYKWHIILCFLHQLNLKLINLHLSILEKYIDLDTLQFRYFILLYFLI